MRRRTSPFQLRGCRRGRRSLAQVGVQVLGVAAADDGENVGLASGGGEVYLAVLGQGVPGGGQSTLAVWAASRRAFIDSGWGRCEGLVAVPGSCGLRHKGDHHGLRIIVSLRVARLADLPPGWVPRGAD